MKGAAERDFSRPAAAAVGLITFVVFLPALRNGFVWDDVRNLTENPYYRGLGLAHLRWMFSTFLLGPYQPLSWLSYAVDFQIWGMNPFGYHLTNLLFHSANAGLFYFLSLRILAAGRPRPEDALGAAAAALIFSLHPLRVESVAWVSERRDVLSGFFFLLALLFWLRSVSGRENPQRLWGAAAWTAYMAALLAKAIVITFPAILVLLDVYPLRRLSGRPRDWLSPRYRALWLEKLPFAIPAAACAAVGLAGQASSGALATLAQAGWGERSAQALFGLSYYLGKSIVPLGLTPVYAWHWQTSSVPYLLSGGCVLAFAGFLVAARKRWPAGLAAFLYYVLCLLPVIGLVKLGHQTVADRYSYLACLSWALLAGAGLRRLCHSRAGFLASAAALTSITILFAGLTRRQIAIWRDPIAFWQHVLDCDATNLTARRQLSQALLADGRASEAALIGRTAAAAQEGTLAMLYNDAGADLLRSGEVERAADYFERALRLDPKLARTHGNLGIALAREGRLVEAIAQFEAALRLEPGNEAFRENLRKAEHLPAQP